MKRKEKGKTILIVDDALTVRMFHRQILEGGGYLVKEASNGFEALEKAIQSSFDLYIVDINMPLLDGYGFVQKLRQNDLPQVPVIMVSTEADAKDRDMAFESGANFYMVKPVKPEYLLKVVHILLGEVIA